MLISEMTPSIAALCASCLYKRKKCFYFVFLGRLFLFALVSKEVALSFFFFFFYITLSQFEISLLWQPQWSPWCRCQVKVVELKVTWITKSYSPKGSDSVYPPASTITQENLCRSVEIFIHRCTDAVVVNFNCSLKCVYLLYFSFKNLNEQL